MKKLLALILAGAMLLTFAACGGNETPENETTTEAVAEGTTEAVAENGTTLEETQADATQAPEAQTGAADAAALLNQVWAKFGDDEKPFVMGGYGDTMVDGAPGKFDISLVEDMDAMLGIPAANVADIDDAASVIHAMNANTFTGAAYHLKEGKDASALASAIEAHLAGRQWMCGIPETLLIVSVDGFVVTAFGANDIVSNFKTKLTGEFASAQILVEKPVA